MATSNTITATITDSNGIYDYEISDTISPHTIYNGTINSAWSYPAEIPYTYTTTTYYILSNLFTSITSTNENIQITPYIPSLNQLIDFNKSENAVSIYLGASGSTTQFTSISVNCSNASSSFTAQTTSTQGQSGITNYTLNIFSNVSISCPSSSNDLLSYTSLNSNKDITTYYTFIDTYSTSLQITLTSSIINNTYTPTQIVVYNSMTPISARSCICYLINIIYGVYCNAQSVLNSTSSSTQQKTDASEVINGTGLAINALGAISALYF